MWGNKSTSCLDTALSSFQRLGTAQRSQISNRGGLQRSLAWLCPGNGQNNVVDEEIDLTTWSRQISTSNP